MSWHKAIATKAHGHGHMGRGPFLWLSRRWTCLLAIVGGMVREDKSCESCFQRFFAERISGIPRLAATADGKDEVTFQANVWALQPCMPKR